MKDAPTMSLTRYGRIGICSIHNLVQYKGIALGHIESYGNQEPYLKTLISILNELKKKESTTKGSLNKEKTMHTKEW